MQTTELRVTDTAGGHQFAIVDDSTGQDIALVYNRNEDSRKTAQLLAAAPTMLTELLHVSERIGTVRPDDAFCQALKQIIDQAIQKATQL
jgi:hypothetical protein